MRPERRSGGWKSVLPGALILVVLIGTSTLVFFMDTIRRALLEGPRIVVVASQARGLVSGADVWIAGSPSGRVTDVLFGDPEGPESERVVILAVLNWQALPHLRSGTTARIGSSALLAPTVLKLVPGSATGSPFDPTDTLYVVPNETRDQFVALASEGRAVADSLSEALALLRERLHGGPGTVASLRRDTALLAALPRMAASAAELSAALRSEDALPALLATDSVGDAVASILAGFRSLAEDERTGRVADSVGELVASLGHVSERLALMDSLMRVGEGTAGRALYDEEIRRQQRLFRARLDTVRTELTRRPWRWLRFKLF